MEDALRVCAQLFQNAGWGFAVENACEGVLIATNESFIALYGCEPLVGQSPAILVHPDVADAWQEAVSRADEEGYGHFESVHRRQDGSSFPVNVDVVCLHGSGDAVAFRAYGIRAQEWAQQALRQTEDLFRLLAENSHDMIFRYRFTEPLGFEYVSPAVTAMAGYCPEDYYADPDFPSKVVHPDDLDMFNRMVTEHMTEPVELRWIRKDGSIMWTEQRNVPIVNPAGQLIALEGAVRDISKRKAAEEALQRTREELEGRVDRQMQEKNPYGLTFREFTVLHLVSGGQSDKEIAAELGISPLTVHKHVASILSKMSAASRTEAGVRALREGLVT
jgi:PAS domain S-box-containing protein